MKRINLLVLLLVCTPMLFAGNINDLFEKWKKDYQKSELVKWEEKEATEKDNAEIREESGIADLSVKKGEGFESSSAEVAKVIRADMANLKIDQPFVPIFNQKLPDNTLITIVGHKGSKNWDKAYIVVVDKNNKSTVFRVEGSLSDASYKEHIESTVAMINQMAAMMSMMK